MGKRSHIFEISHCGGQSQAGRQMVRRRAIHSPREFKRLQPASKRKIEKRRKSETGRPTQPNLLVDDRDCSRRGESWEAKLLYSGEPIFLGMGS